jgi:hypothetical protein
VLPAAFIKMLSTYARYSPVASLPINGFECTMPYEVDMQCLKKGPVLLGSVSSNLDCSGCSRGELCLALARTGNGMLTNQPAVHHQRNISQMSHFLHTQAAVPCAAAAPMPLARMA